MFAPFLILDLVSAGLYCTYGRHGGYGIAVVLGFVGGMIVMAGDSYLRPLDSTACSPDDLECVNVLARCKLLMSYASGFYMGFGGTGACLTCFRRWPELKL